MDWENHWEPSSLGASFIGNHWEPNSWGASLETIRTAWPPVPPPPPPKAKKIKINWALWSASWAIPLTRVQIWRFLTFVRHHFPLGIIHNIPLPKKSAGTHSCRSSDNYVPTLLGTGNIMKKVFWCGRAGGGGGRPIELYICLFIERATRLLQWPEHLWTPYDGNLH